MPRTTQRAPLNLNDKERKDLETLLPLEKRLCGMFSAPRFFWPMPKGRRSRILPSKSGSND